MKIYRESRYRVGDTIVYQSPNDAEPLVLIIADVNLAVKRYDVMTTKHTIALSMSMELVEQRSFLHSRAK